MESVDNPCGAGLPPENGGKIMPAVLLHKARRKWMGRRENLAPLFRRTGPNLQEGRRPVQAAAQTAPFGQRPLQGGRVWDPPLRTSSASLRSAPSPKWEGLRAAKGRPYSRRRTERISSTEPGAVLDTQQRQFLHTQGPVARIE